MKQIFLLGDFSSYHVNLKSGLNKIGVDATVLTNGDGWKRISADINIQAPDKSLVSKIKYRIALLKEIIKIKNYDVVQIMNFHCISIKFFPTKLILKILKRNNKKIFLLAAGSDPFFWSYGRKRLKYGPFNDVIKYDLKGRKDKNQNESLLALNEYIANKCDGIIPIMFEYQVSYKHKVNLKNVIQIPIDLKKYQYEDNVVNDKLVIFHGLNKAGFKGTHHIKEAFERLEEAYPNDVELIIDGNMPLEEYVKLMKRTNVIIDQVNSHSLGVNGVIGLALGKIVVGGAEQESLDSFSLEYSPVVNVPPDPDRIYEELEKLILNKSMILQKGIESRKFAEQFHSDVLVAKKFYKQWFE